jgi:hypothetical protein
VVSQCPRLLDDAKKDFKRPHGLHPETEKVDFVSGLFDLTTIKGKAGVTADGDQKWRVAAFNPYPFFN